MFEVMKSEVHYDFRDDCIIASSLQVERVPIFNRDYETKQLPRTEYVRAHAHTHTTVNDHNLLKSFAN